MRHNAEDEPREISHQPVLVRELAGYIENSPLQGKGILVDGTLGEGGHSEHFLASFPDIRIVAFERDADILEVGRARLERFKDRIDFINDNFKSMGRHLDQYRGEIAYMLFDFGISSFHYEKSGRGFAHSRDEKLDMRLDSSISHDAGYIVNNYPEKELAYIIYRYGEERRSRRIAALICRERKNAPIRTTGELASLVLRAIPRQYHVKNIHPATRVFQALRIAVNDELGAIDQALILLPELLAPGGRAMAISFHSLEDRIVKDRFRRLARGCSCESEVKYCQCDHEPFIKILTKKPVIAAMDEVEANPRARSAKLRVGQKL